MPRLLICLPCTDIDCFVEPDFTWVSGVQYMETITNVANKIECRSKCQHKNPCEYVSYSE